jgi:hypothetical protein
LRFDIYALGIILVGANVAASVGGTRAALSKQHHLLYTVVLLECSCHGDKSFLEKSLKLKYANVANITPSILE